MKNIDFLLAYPNPNQDSPARYTPLSILYPGAFFESQGYKVAYFDQRFDPPEMLDDLIRHAKEIGVSAFTGYQSGQAARILKRAKEIDPTIITGVGGHHPQTVGADEILAEDFIDKVWLERSYGEDLFPFHEGTKIHFQRTDMQYFTSRGCPFPCTFCALTSPWLPKDIILLDRELKHIHHEIGFSELSFSDPNIGFGIWRNQEGKNERMDRVQRIRDIGKIMRDINARWDGNIRAPYLTPDMVEALAEANCYSIEIGCESGNDYFLRKIIKKGHGVEAIKNAAKNVKGSGISVMYSFIAFMPGESIDMLHDTLDLIDWIVDTDPDARVSIYHYAPYPGSPMYLDAIRGLDGYKPFVPPTTMEGWGAMRLMASSLYWIAGLNFRMDNTRKNFPGEDWQIIQPYVKLAQERWRARDIDDFPYQDVERLIKIQAKKRGNYSAS